MARSEAQTANIILLGGGAVGTIKVAALNIETGKLDAVTAVLTSGYRIGSVDHGKLPGWRPTKGPRVRGGDSGDSSWTQISCG